MAEIGVIDEEDTAQKICCLRHCLEDGAERVVMRRAAHLNPAIPRPGEPGYSGSEVYQNIRRNTVVPPEIKRLFKQMKTFYGK